MTISGEKAPAFSAKTLNLPTTPEDSTARIVELSRERYTKERNVVEQRIFEATGMESLAPQQQPESQPRSEQAHDTPPAGDIGKVVSGLIKSDGESSSVVNNTNSQQRAKRKRTRRGGRGRKRKAPVQSDNNIQQVSRSSKPAKEPEPEQVIKLR